MPPVIAKSASKAQRQNEPGSSVELRLLQGYVAHLKKKPDEGRELLVKAGIYTKTGNLTKAFGG